VSGLKLDHLDMVVSDLERSLAFYQGLLEPLGWTRTATIEGERGEKVFYIGGELGERWFALGLREAQSDSHATPYDRYGVGVHHVAFEARSRGEVDERHEWLLAQGADVESAPREYDYTPSYYAVFFADPDGIKLELVHKPDWPG
jgi:catechol 2,3-dioxygenase-like lactoylglutathione lyase family enzyme